MEPLATLVQLAERLPWDMDLAEQREALGDLSDLSDEARFYGNVRWETPELTPYPVVNLILKAAARHRKNPEGYTTSRAGDEAVGWSDRSKNVDEAGSATFSPAERQRLADIGGRQRSTFHSVGMFAYQQKPNVRQEGLVPDAGSTEPFPMFSSDTEPW